MPSFSLSKFDHLRKIIIGSNCFKNTQYFSLVSIFLINLNNYIDLKVLNYLSIEENCFMMKLQNSLFELQGNYSVIPFIL